ncbi:hypothetical protein D9M70_549610 [compost metagenome]
MIPTLAVDAGGEVLGLSLLTLLGDCGVNPGINALNGIAGAFGTKDAKLRGGNSQSQEPIPSCIPPQRLQLGL